MPLLTRRAVDPAGSVISGDCISGMAAMPASCVDLVVTDPPFAIRFKAGRSNYNRKAGNVLPGYMEVEREDCGVQPGLDRRGAPRPQGLWLDVRVFGVDPPQGCARRP